MVLLVCLLGWEALARWEREHLPLETKRELGSKFLRDASCYFSTQVFFFFFFWWCIINKYEWSFDLLLHILRVGKWLLGLGEFLLMRVFVLCTSLVALHQDYGGGKMKWAAKKMKGNECEVGRQTELLDLVLRNRSHKKTKN